MANRAFARFALLVFPTIAAIAGGAPAEPPASVIKGENLINHLNAAIRWYRLSDAGSQWLSQPSDEYFCSTQRNLSNQVLQKAFASAKGELPLVPPAAQQAPAAMTVEQQRIARLTADRAGRLQRLHDDIDALDARIRAAASPDERAALAARRDALQSEVNFYDALQRSLQTVGGMLASPGEQGGATTLAGEIEVLAQSVPEALGGAAAQAAAVAPAVKAADTGGLIARTMAFSALMKDLRSLDHFIAETIRLKDEVGQVQAPLRAVTRDVIQQGEQAGEHLPDDPSQAAAARHRLDALTEKFGQLAAASMPLREESVLLDQSLRNLGQWRDSVNARYSQVIHSLLNRVLGVAAVLGAVIGLSELWRHMTFRYVQEDRRKRQFLLVRRFVTGALMAVVLIIGFISDFSSIITFAGLATAGIAVALQTIIVSIAAYFFLIGRYGIKVGDRITVCGVSAPGVTGEVVDLGLLRFHLIELTDNSPEARPTGRAIVFPNSVIFLANPIYRQMPGADFVWREAAVSLVPGADASLVRDNLLSAVNAAHSEYSPLLEQNRPRREKLHGVRFETVKPYAQLRARGRGLEVVVGYPANLRQSVEIDQIVSRSVTKAFAGEPDLQGAIAGTPRIGPIAQASPLPPGRLGKVGAAADANALAEIATRSEKGQTPR